ncbi:MAG: peptidase M14, partial [Nitrospinaceae bacterium]|nr:peptidase M14 [Nitrospinaceae bacterium]NIR55089.1 peptidase M14 [Nitrospinaceae bacterium]NIS85498.1 peptidase M14 [Nitrospinaceae bacterium]NIT81646.1 peptidase M14 [Nitrospinaceae bacterium]NIU44554.1 peptidase M14 [Nitrospinaceae bacterium]
YNRIWNGGETPEHALADQVVDTVTRDGIFATVDVHNSSGKNPHYACINRLENPYVNLGRRFSRTLVYFTRPAEVLSCRFAPYGPSISIESGLPGEPQGVQHVAQFLEECLRGESIPGEAIENPDCDLYHSTVCIRVPRRSTVGFENNGSNLDFCFIENLDLINFSELPENALL